MHELIAKTAREIVAGLARGDWDTETLLDALETRIAETDPAINALPTRCFERARDRARDLSRRPSRARGVLGGTPIAIKDLANVAGVRSTHGSPIYRDHVPVVSDHIVTRIEARGGIVYAKSNTPEFGAGASTFNPVFGRTANPWNTACSAAGSSGGAAAALAAGSAWLAHGSDMGGSLRNPASFCGVCGLRPSAGRVPRGPAADALGTLGAEGPMARTVGDIGLFLDAMAGPHPAEPLGLPDCETGFQAAAEAPRLPARVAWSRDLGLSPVDPEIARITEAAAHRFAGLGVVVEEACPDYAGAMDCFQTLRAVSFATGLAGEYADRRADLKPDIIWNIEKGMAVTGVEIARANATRSRLIAAHAAFFETYDLLLCPTTIVPPFPVEDRTVTHCDGVEFETYIDWLAIVSTITLTCAPALSLPCGFTADGLPVGLQLVGRFRGEAALLSHAAALEAELALALGPIDPRAPIR